MTESTEAADAESIAFYARKQAREVERARCISILAALDPPIDPAAMEAIRSGKTPQGFDVSAAAAPATPKAGATPGKWGDIAARFNERKAGNAPAEGSAT